ncbi:MAG: CocE/NonD family hydrolase [Spirochaetaceae bacterium]
MMHDALHSVNEIEHTLIPLSDGIRLAARIWMPEGAENRPVPALLEYIPYRKRDFTALRDAGMHRYFAERGFAGVRVDLRGSGESEGILRDEYLQQELCDGLEILRWIAAQPWCTGRVGMFGLSWGGFNALQIAALRPPELGAIITVCSTDDRYRDDIHYMGGALLTDNLSWASTMFAYNSCPPDPTLYGEGWRSAWLARLEQSGLWLRTWLGHQRKDDYWRHGSVSEDYTTISCPVYAVSGWADGYSNTVFRLLESLSVPVKGLIGAWGHKYPHLGKPGPAIGFLQEAVRWWNRWLRDEENGIMEEPALQVWMQDSASPISEERPGRWIAEDGWPSPRVFYRRYAMSSTGRLEADLAGEAVGAAATTPPPETARTADSGAVEPSAIESPLSVGLFAGKWYSYSSQTDLPYDQREEDGGALVFETPELRKPVEILGAPICRFRLQSNKPVAMIACRISDIAPDGGATRITYGVLNLTHRQGHDRPEELPTDRWIDVDVPLNHIAQRFDTGHRIRLSLSTSYWPLVWPAPESPRLTLDPAASSLSLPLREDTPAQPTPREFAPAESADPPEHSILIPPHREWTVTHNLADNEARLTVINNDAKYRLERDGWTFHREVTENYSYRRNRYDTLRAEVRAVRSFEQGHWTAETHTRTLLTSSSTHFRIQATLDAFEGDTRVFSKSWDERVPRHLL